MAACRYGTAAARVTSQTPDGGPPFEAELVEDEFHMLWLYQTNRRGERIGIRSCSRLRSRSGGAS